MREAGTELQKNPSPRRDMDNSVARHKGSREGVSELAMAYGEELDSSSDSQSKSKTTKVHSEQQNDLITTRNAIERSDFAYQSTVFGAKA